MRLFRILISQFLTPVPSKFVPKTLYKLGQQKKPSLHHFHVWGFKVEVRSYNPHNPTNLIQKPLVGTLLVIVWDQEVPGFIARRTPPE